ncbi:MAG: lysophospholipid acyltransferase family protein, partial [Mycobacteriaceae bacterium]
MLYWLAKYVFIGPLLRITCRPRVHGLENLPVTGPAILASNHLAVVDSFFLALMVPRRLTFLAKSEYFTAPGLAGWLKKMFFAGMGQVPIDRSSAEAAESALLTGVGILREGKLLGIYPEGTRSPDGR